MIFSRFSERFISYSKRHPSLNANGATFDRSGSSGTWGGIKFNSSASGSITNCTIKYASRGIDCNGYLPTIEHNTIESSGIGIYLNNIGTTTKKIYGNSITLNASIGISCNYSSPEIEYNFIGPSSLGMFCLDSSPEVYNNYFFNNSTCIFLVNNSSPSLGLTQFSGNGIGIKAEPYCFTSIHTNNIEWTGSYGIEARGFVVISATNNY